MQVICNTYVQILFSNYVKSESTCKFQNNVHVRELLNTEYGEVYFEQSKFAFLLHWDQVLNISDTRVKLVKFLKWRLFLAIFVFAISVEFWILFWSFHYFDFVVLNQGIIDEASITEMRV